MTGQPAPLVNDRPQDHGDPEVWKRILDAGVAVLGEGGLERFTLSAVCQRAGVTPRSVYDGEGDTDDLFLSVYEHGMAGVRAKHTVFDLDEPWAGLTPRETVEHAVNHIINVFNEHAPFLRSVVLVSGANPEVYRRGAMYTNELEEGFTRRVASVMGDTGPNSRERIRAAFTIVFSSLTLRTAYGPDFYESLVEADQFRSALPEMVTRYLDV